MIGEAKPTKSIQSNPLSNTLEEPSWAESTPLSTTAEEPSWAVSTPREPSQHTMVPRASTNEKPPEKISTVKRSLSGLVHAPGFYKQALLAAIDNMVMHASAITLRGNLIHHYIIINHVIVQNQELTYEMVANYKWMYQIYCDYTMPNDLDKDALEVGENIPINDEW